MRRRRRLWIILLAAPLAAGRRHALLADRRQQPGAWLCRLACRAAAAGWTVQQDAGARRLAAGSDAHRAAVSLKGGDPDIPGGLTWSAERLVLRVALLRPGLLEIAAEGSQRLRLARARRSPSRPIAFASCCRCSRGRGRDFVDVAVDDLRAAFPGRRRCQRAVAAPASGFQAGGAVRRAGSGFPARWPRRSARRPASPGRSVPASPA